MGFVKTSNNPSLGSVRVIVRLLPCTFKPRFFSSRFPLLYSSAFLIIKSDEILKAIAGIFRVRSEKWIVDVTKNDFDK